MHRTQKANSRAFNSIDAYIGMQLRARRVRMGLSESLFSILVGTTPKRLAEYEAGNVRIKAARLFRIAKRLGVTVPYFYEGLGDEPLVQNARPPIASGEADAFLDVQRLLNVIDLLRDDRADVNLRDLAEHLRGAPTLPAGPPEQAEKA